MFTEAKISLPSAGLFRRMPYCFSINTMSSSASIESNPSPSPNKGAASSMSSGRMSSSDKASIICFFKVSFSSSILFCRYVWAQVLCHAPSVLCLLVCLCRVLACFFMRHAPHYIMLFALQSGCRLRIPANRQPLVWPPHPLPPTASRCPFAPRGVAMQ